MTNEEKAKEIVELHIVKKYNNEHKGWPKLLPHLMSEGDMRAWKEQQEREYEMFDRW